MGGASEVDRNPGREGVGKCWAKPAGGEKRKEVPRITVVTRMNLYEFGDSE